MGTLPPALAAYEAKKKSGGKKAAGKATPWDPDGDGDVDIPSKLPPGMKNTGDTDKDAAALKKGRGRKPAEGSAAEEATETPAQEKAEDAKSSGPIKRVRDMVAAHSKVPDAKKPAYRAKCIGAARKAGAMQHIPPAWLKKGD